MQSLSIFFASCTFASQESMALGCSRSRVALLSVLRQMKLRLLLYFPSIHRPFLRGSLLDFVRQEMCRCGTRKDTAICLSSIHSDFAYSEWLLCTFSQLGPITKGAL